MYASEYGVYRCTVHGNSWSKLLPPKPMHVKGLANRCDVCNRRICDTFQGTMPVLCTTVYLNIGGEWDNVPTVTVPGACCRCMFTVTVIVFLGVGSRLQGLLSVT